MLYIIYYIRCIILMVLKEMVAKNYLYLYNPDFDNSTKTLKDMKIHLINLS